MAPKAWMWVVVDDECLVEPELAVGVAVGVPVLVGGGVVCVTVVGVVWVGEPTEVATV